MNVDEYNNIGADLNGSKDQMSHDYITRKKEAEKAQIEESIKIDKKEITKKKKIITPETATNKKYFDMIANKKQILANLLKTRGYARTFLENLLPNQMKYECVEEDLLFIKETNKKSGGTPQLKVRNFERYIEILEETNGSKEGLIAPEIGLKALKERLDVKSSAWLIESNFNSLYNYWKARRDELKRPLLRKYWKVALQIDPQNPHVAFRARDNRKIKTRRSIKTYDYEYLPYLQQSAEEAKEALLLCKLLKSREVIKNSDTELSIQAFYSQAGIKQEIRLNTYYTPVDLRTKVLPGTKQLMNKAKSLINTQAIIEQDVKRFEERNSIASPKGSVRSSTRRQERPNNDLNYFMCSVISKANQFNLKLNEINFENLEQLSQKIWAINKEIGQRITSQGKADQSPDPDTTEPPKKLKKSQDNEKVQIILRKRISRGGALYIDRFENEVDDDLEVVDRIQYNSYLSENPHSLEDMIDKMKQLRYESIQGEFGFEEDETELDKIKTQSFSSNFKNFLKQRKVA